MGVWGCGDVGVRGCGGGGVWGCEWLCGAGLGVRCMGMIFLCMRGTSAPVDVGRSCCVWSRMGMVNMVWHGGSNMCQVLNVYERTPVYVCM